MEAIDKADRIIYLCNRMLAGNIDDQEAKELNVFLTHSEGNASVWQELDTLSAKEYGRPIVEYDHQSAWNTLKKRLFPGIYSDSKSSAISSYRIAAALVLIIGVSVIGYLTFFRSDTAPNTGQTPFEVRPGTNQPALILADGTQINLDSVKVGTLIQQNGTEIYKKDDKELVYTPVRSQEFSSDLNTLFVPNGALYRLTLPDGSHVVINSGSTLRYPVRFADSNRVVSLSGEAYFDVKETGQKDAFKVRTDHTEVTVLGTQFNVKAYSNEPAVTTSLLKGKLEVKSAEQSVALRSGQEARVIRSDGDSIKIQPISKGVIGWTEGVIQYNGRLDGFMRIIERHFNVEVVYVDVPEKNRNDNLQIEIPMSVSLAKYIEIINETFNQPSHGYLWITQKENKLIMTYNDKRNTR